MEAFSSSVRVVAGSDDRLVDTAVEMARALTGNARFGAGDVEINDAMLSDVSQAAAQLASAERELSSLMHCRSASEALLHRHLPGMVDLLQLPGVPRRCDPRGLTPLDVLLHVHELIIVLAGGTKNVMLARASGTPVLPELKVILMLGDESGEQFQSRWADVSANFVLASVSLPATPETPSCESPASAFPSLPPGNYPVQALLQIALSGTPVFDVTTISKIADYLTYDVEHTVAHLEAKLNAVSDDLRPQGIAASPPTMSPPRPGLVESNDFSPSPAAVVERSNDSTAVRDWCTRAILTLSKLLPIVKVLTNCVNPISFGISKSERYIAASLISGNLLREISRHSESLIERDTAAGVRAMMEAMLERKLRHSSGSSSLRQSLSTMIESVLPAVTMSSISGQNDVPNAQLYFAPNSHVTSVLHCLHESPVVSDLALQKQSHLHVMGYMTQVYFMVFRNVYDTTVLPSLDPFAAEFDVDKPLPGEPEAAQVLLRALEDKANAVWRQRYRYTIVPYLSNGSRTMVKQEEAHLFTTQSMPYVPPTTIDGTIQAPGAPTAPANGMQAEGSGDKQLLIHHATTSVLAIHRLHSGFSLHQLRGLCNDVDSVSEVFMQRSDSM